MFDKVMRRVLALPHGIPGFMGTTRCLRSRSIGIVAYHGVVPSPLPVFNWCQLCVTEFEKQLEFLSQEYTVLPLAEVIDRLCRQAALPPSTVCLTFDDGFRNVYKVAYPLLERRQLPATVFLITGLVGTNQAAWPDQLFDALLTTSREYVTFERSEWPLATQEDRAATYGTMVERLKGMDVERKEQSLAQVLEQTGQSEISTDSCLSLLDWSEVEELSKTGLVDFGSHTHTHPILSRCPLNRQEEELRLSRDALKEHGKGGDLFAYPNGTSADFTGETKQLVQRLGYRCGLSTIAGLQSVGGDLYAMRRVCVGADTTLSQFELRMAGL